MFNGGLTDNRRVARWLSYGLVVITFVLVSWFGYDRYTSVVENKKKTADFALTKAKDSIESSISTKQRLLDNFVFERKSEIVKLVNNPNDHANYDNIYKSLKRQMPSLFTINVFTHDGKLVIADFEGFVGDLCVQDLNSSLKDKIHKKRTHPNNVLYHYDEISKFTYRGKTYLFFASFSLSEIASTLLYATPRNHNLMLIDSDNNNLIEITNTGGRDTLVHRNQLRLSEQESQRIVSRLAIPETFWTVVDVEDPGQGKQALLAQVTPSAAIFLFVSMIILVMQRVVDKNFVYLGRLNQQLEERNQEITVLNTELERMAVKDPLTGLYNRRYFEDQFEKEWNRAMREGHSLCVMIIDIDRFKIFNDLYGHIKGDNCLKLVAEAIRSCFSRGGEFVARFGGEEFIGVVNDDADACLKIAESLHEKLKSEAIAHEGSIAGVITVSIGIASAVPEMGKHSLDLVKQADTALYQAKKEGRNRTVVFEPGQ